MGKKREFRSKVEQAKLSLLCDIVVMNHNSINNYISLHKKFVEYIHNDPDTMFLLRFVNDLEILEKKIINEQNKLSDYKLELYYDVIKASSASVGFISDSELASDLIYAITNTDLPNLLGAIDISFFVSSL